MNPSSSNNNYDINDDSVLDIDSTPSNTSTSNTENEKKREFPFFQRVPPLDKDHICYHWLAKGSCKQGDQCIRAQFHIPLLAPLVSVTKNKDNNNSNNNQSNNDDNNNNNDNHNDNTAERFYYFYRVPREKPTHLLAKTLQTNGFHPTNSIQQCDLLWAHSFPESMIINSMIINSNNSHINDNSNSGKSGKSCKFKRGLIINHLPRSVELSHKHNLYRHLNGIEYLPVSFVYPQDRTQLLWWMAGDREQRLWICKPVGLGEGNHSI